MNESAQSPQIQQNQILLFLDALTAVCHKFSLAISGRPELFVLQTEDFQRKYYLDINDRMEFI